MRPATPSRFGERLWLAFFILIAVVAVALWAQKGFGAATLVLEIDTLIPGVILCLAISLILRRRRLIAETRSADHERMIATALGARVS